MKITIPISVGELLDKISILQIKSQHTTSYYVKQELKDLIEIAKQHQVYDEQELQSLIEINSKLWDIEDDLRRIEKEQKENNTFTFGHNFISLARSVYITNDERARIKKEINEKYNSQYQEVKCYF
jgi:hypothetical protein